MTVNILIIDDDKELCSLLKEYLEGQGLRVGTFYTGQEGINVALSGVYNLLILDVMLPDMSGYDVLKKIQQSMSLPVIMLTAKGDEVDLVVGLEMGADDYIAKPCRPRELLARITAVTRRFGNSAPTTERQQERQDSPFEFLDEQLVVKIDNVDINLTTAEFNIFSLLNKNFGVAVSKEDISRIALGRRLTPYDRSIDVHVSNMRKKIQPYVSGKEFIKSVRGKGYIFTG
ncbi:MAG: DNA-binding response regulator [Gammaproteobacteria bacterium]|nr:MAG: DNA-binding response regulator [Gammaproteobacteria bacterium]